MKKNIVKKMLINESEIRRMIRLLIENIVDETKEALISKLARDETSIRGSSSDTKGFRAFDRSARYHTAASKLLWNFNIASKDFSNSSAKDDIKDQEVRSKLNIGYWKKRFSNPSDLTAIDEFKNFTEYLKSLAAISATKIIDHYADNTTLKFNLKNPRGLPFSVIFKFTHQAAVRTAEKMGGSALCTAESGTCANFRRYSSEGPLVTLTAIPGESFEERKEQHGNYENPKDVKPSTYNVQTNLNLLSAFDLKTGEFDPEYASFGMTMWYDDSNFFDPNENIPKLYGIGAKDIAALLLKAGDKSKKFIDHILDIGPKIVDSHKAQEKLEKSLGLKNPTKEWLKNWSQVSLSDGEIIRVIPTVKIFKTLPPEEKMDVANRLNISAFSADINSRKIYSNVKFDAGIITAVPGVNNRVWECDFENCNFVGNKDDSSNFVPFIGCNFNGGTINSDFIGDLRAKKSKPYFFKNVKIHPEARIKTQDAHIQDCVFHGLSIGLPIRFSGGKILNTKFENCNLNNYELSYDDDQIELSNLVFTNCSLVRTDFSGSAISNIKFVNCDLTRSNFYKIDLSSIEFIDCKMDEMIVSKEFAEKIVNESVRTRKNSTLKTFKKPIWINNMKKLKLNESQLHGLVKRILSESPGYPHDDQDRAFAVARDNAWGPSPTEVDWVDEVVDLAKRGLEYELNEYLHDFFHSEVPTVGDDMEEWDAWREQISKWGRELDRALIGVSYDAKSLAKQQFNDVSRPYYEPSYI